MWVFLALIAIPAIEIGLFIEVGGVIGVWPTIAIIFLTALLGAALLRAQGFTAMTRLQAALAAGEDPLGPLAEGAMILFAGALMLVPGFFTDIVGFLLLLPPVRSTLIRVLGPALAARSAHRAAGRAPGDRRPAPDEAIDVEYQDVTGDDPRRPGRPSGWTQPPE